MIPCTVTNISVLEETTKTLQKAGPLLVQSKESVFTNLDKSATFSTGSDQSDNISIPSQTSALVPSLTSSKRAEGNEKEKISDKQDSQQDMEIDQEIEITTKGDQEGTLAQNSSTSGLTGTTATQNNKELFQHMSQSKSVMEMLKVGILIEEQVHQIAYKLHLKIPGQPRLNALARDHEAH